MTGCVRLQNCVYMKCLNKGGSWSANIKFKKQKNKTTNNIWNRY